MYAHLECMHTATRAFYYMQKRRGVAAGWEYVHTLGAHTF